MLHQRSDVVVIGAGVAGLSTAIWARRLGLSALVLDQAPEPGGNLRAIHYQIADYPGLPPTSGAALALHLHRQAEEGGAVIRLDLPVTAVNIAGLTCQTAEGPITGRALVLATGLAPRRLGVPGEPQLYEQGLVRRPSVTPAWFAGKRVAIIGGGDRAAENALMVARQAERVWLLHRADRLRARQTFREQLAAAPGIELLRNTQVTAFAVADGRATLRLMQGGQPLSLEADAVCIYIGNRPNTELVAGQADLSPEGYLIVDRSGRSSTPGLYGVGDVCTDPQYQSLITGAAQGMMAAKQIALSLGEQPAS